MSPEVVSRLNAKNHSWEIIPAQFGAITAIDIAGAFGFANLTELQSSLLYFKWAKQTDQQRPLTKSLWSSTKGISEAIGWPKYRPNLIWEICEMAVKEHCILPTCKRCSGQKFLPEVIDSIPTGKMVPCSTCFGYGLSPRKRQEMMWNLGMNPRDFNRYGWSKLYKSMIDILSKAEFDAFKSLRFA